MWNQLNKVSWILAGGFSGDGYILVNYLFLLGFFMCLLLGMKETVHAYRYRILT